MKENLGGIKMKTLNQVKQEIIANKKQLNEKTLNELSQAVANEYGLTVEKSFSLINAARAMNFSGGMGSMFAELEELVKAVKVFQTAC